jgi:type I restriction enzyme M protein
MQSEPISRVLRDKELEFSGWSLNPGRYAGVPPGEVASDEDLKEQLETSNEELETEAA